MLREGYVSTATMAVCNVDVAAIFAVYRPTSGTRTISAVADATICPLNLWERISHQVVSLLPGKKR
jgi:hypothetical protein